MAPPRIIFNDFFSEGMQRISADIRLLCAFVLKIRKDEIYIKRIEAHQIIVRDLNAHRHVQVLHRKL